MGCRQCKQWLEQQSRMAVTAVIGYLLLLQRANHSTIDSHTLDCPNDTLRLLLAYVLEQINHRLLVHGNQSFACPVKVDDQQHHQGKGNRE